MGHFETKSDACHCAYIGLILLQKLTFWRPARVAREARGFSMPRPQIVVQFGDITLSTSPISKLRAADDERRQAERNSLADRLAVEAKALADLKIEKAADEGERAAQWHRCQLTREQFCLDN